MPINREADTGDGTETAELRPSEIVRAMPESRWGRGAARRLMADGEVQLCALGELADMAGYDWPAPLAVRVPHRPDPSQAWQMWDAPYGFITERYGIPFSVQQVVAHVNDSRGRVAAADVLEESGS